MNHDDVTHEEILKYVRDDYGNLFLQELLIEIILKTRHQNKSGVKGRVDKALNAILGAPDKTRLSDLNCI